MPQSNEVPHKYCPLGVGHYGFRTHGVDEVRLGHLRLCQKRRWPGRLAKCLPEGAETGAGISVTLLTSLNSHLYRAAVAQLVARRSHNPKVESSTLSCRTSVFGKSPLASRAALC